MALPAGLTTVTITGSYDSAEGASQSGAVIITPTETVLDAAGKLVIAAVPITHALSGGSFTTLPLPCTDNAGLVPLELGVHGDGRGRGGAADVQFGLPQALGGTAGTVDITALTPSPNCPAANGIVYLPNTTSAPSVGRSGGGGFLYSLNGTLWWVNGNNTPVVIGPGPASGYGLVPPAGDIGGTGLNPTVVSTHLSSALPVGQGGTGGSAVTSYAVVTGGTTTGSALQQVPGLGASGQILTSQGAGSLPSWQNAPAGFTNPMAALGDMISGGTAGTALRLAGGTVTTKQFLTQTGTGSASAAPAWGTITTADLPSLPVATASALGAVELAGDLSGTATSVQVVSTHLTSPLPVLQGGTGGTATAWSPLLTQTAVQSANYTASVNQIVPCDISGTSITVKLPTGGSAGSLFAAEVAPSPGWARTP